MKTWRERERVMEGIPAINNIIRSLRLRWAGHVARMSLGRPLRLAMLGIPQRRRPVGRPKKRWSDNLQEDLAALGVYRQRWIEAAAQRRDWRGFVFSSRRLIFPSLAEYSPLLNSCSHMFCGYNFLLFNFDAEGFYFSYLHQSGTFFYDNLQ